MRVGNSELVTTGTAAERLGVSGAYLRRVIAQADGELEELRAGELAGKPVWRWAPFRNWALARGVGSHRRTPETLVKFAHEILEEEQ
jgi:hypothetical protein